LSDTAVSDDAGGNMLLEIARKWWVLLIHGVCAIIFGILAFIWPGITLFALVTLFGIYCLIDGITAIGVAFAPRATGKVWWQMLFVGILAIIAGVTAFFWPGITAVSLLLIIAFWAIARGVMEIVAAVELRKLIAHEWLLALAGVASIAFGAILIARPDVGALTVAWIIGAYALAYGIILVALSLRTRRFKSVLQTAANRFA
jgi:uncharacterized membrane protein HdeD (DUF308 family)